MKTTCATIIQIGESTGEILIGHTTHNTFWSLPKGVMEDGETEEECAKREVLEETNIDLSGQTLEDLGKHEYLKNKDLHLFRVKLAAIPDNIMCTSFFELHGRMVPEFDDFAWMLPEDDQLFSKLFNKQVEILKKFYK